MKNFVPYEKLSKRERSARDAARRVTWDISPVTRKPKKPGAYDRAKARTWDQDDLRFGLCSAFHTEAVHPHPAINIGFAAGHASQLFCREVCVRLWYITITEGENRSAYGREKICLSRW